MTPPSGVALKFISSPAATKLPGFFARHSELENKPISILSCFLVAKALEGIKRKSFKAKKLSSGDLLVEVQRIDQSSALRTLNTIAEFKVILTAHRTLNTSRGVIFKDNLLDPSVEEIIERLPWKAVIRARRICLRRDGEEKPTKHIIVTFYSTKVPAIVKAG